MYSMIVWKRNYIDYNRLLLKIWSTQYALHIGIITLYYAMFSKHTKTHKRWHAQHFDDAAFFQIHCQDHSQLNLKKRKILCVTEVVLDQMCNAHCNVELTFFLLLTQTHLHCAV